MKQDIIDILRLMKNPNKVRNVGFAGHVDHGKTTATDSLLAYCGLVSPELAGQVRYLDYLEVEQRRGITIKTAAITTIVTLHNGEQYLLNLIDTPGHVDFSGKVSRALRLMDGVIIVVDAVEGIMAQTEAYLRLALEEHVRPILYINKIDRLIDELSLSLVQIQNRLEEIILGFNDIIETWGFDYQRKEWKVNPKDETVIFGCAIGRWGFSLPQAIKLGIRFADIVNMYKNEPMKLSSIIPLGEIFATIIYKKVPPPNVAQEYRIRYLWNQENVPPFILSCQIEATTVFYVSKSEWKSGRIFVTGRVFSGILSKRDYICLNTHKEYHVDAVHLLLGHSTTVVNEIPAGNVFGAILRASPGQTFASELIPGYFRLPVYIAVPVVFVAIEPKKAQDFGKLIKELEALKIGDPNISVDINKDTGEILLGGIGELHLEIILSELSKRVEIYSSEPMVAYREILVKGGQGVDGGVSVLIEPIGENVSLNKLIAGEVPNAVDGNIIEIRDFSPDEKEAIMSIIANTLKNGPLIGEPILGCRIVIEKIDKRATTDINEVLNAFSKAMMSVKTELCEPYYEFELSTKIDYVGALTAEINRRGGKINSMESGAGGLIRIKGIIPVRSSLGLPSVIRSLAHGRAYIQLRFHNYLLATEKSKEAILKEIRLRKGLEL